MSFSIDPIVNLYSLDTNSISDFYAISPFEINLQKPTVLRIAIPDSFVADDLKDQPLVQ